MATIHNYKNGKYISSVQKVKRGGETIISTTTNVSDIRREKIKQSRERRQIIGEVSSLGTGLFSIVLFILMLAVFSRFMFSNQDFVMPTLEGFLDMLGNFRVISNEFLFGIKDTLQIVADWGIFNGFRDILNFLGSVISFVVWIVSGLVNVVSFSLAFIGWIFGL